MNIFVGGNYFVYHGNIQNNTFLDTTPFGWGEGCAHFFFSHLSSFKKYNQTECAKKISNVKFVLYYQNDKREETEVILCKKCSLLLGYSNTLDEKLCPSFIVNGMLKM